MKSPCSADADNKPDQQHRGCRWRSLPATVVGAVLVWLSCADGQAQTPDACQQSAADAFASCQRGAQSDHRLALGKCDNISDATVRNDCENRAAKRFQEAQTLCDKQNSLRQNVCERLGGGTYEPAID